jgi:hypothetical protein
MANKTLFPVESPVVQRQPKTDRLILASFLKNAAEDRRLDENAIKAAHAVLVKWADLETSARLAKWPFLRFRVSNETGIYYGESFSGKLPTERTNLFLMINNYR